ncbi:MAG: GNAT family N-acetyltransferase [Candidatus Hinthialibacter antarcticus]|nr:GNAT family N-acetyltransferase [Candidatus Hinthialibacter antarcticus]
MDENQSAIQLRTMVQDDLPHCQRLKQQIGWNQRLEDWIRFLALNPAGCFVATHCNKIVGTVCTVAYQHFGWVAMVIVDPDYRRKGIGRLLLLEGIEHLERRGLAVKLDATPQGKMLYDTLGFQDEYTGARYECGSIQNISGNESTCRSFSIEHLDEIAQFDCDIFGDDRKAVLASYLQYGPELAYWVKDGDNILGYMMAREGENAFHIGPWVAVNRDVAQRLLQHGLHQRKPDRVFVDIVSPNPHAETMLQEWGFIQQRMFIRMVRGENQFPGQPKYVYGMSGPELG